MPHVVRFGCFFYCTFLPLSPVYKQPGWLSVDEPRQGLTVKGRNNWSVKEFANKYNLGNPVAPNFFQAQWDEYVPKLYEMLG